MRRPRLKFGTLEVRSLLTRSGDKDILNSLEALMLAVADELRRCCVPKTVKRRGGVAR
jgi:hypothetical protein